VKGERRAKPIGLAAPLLSVAGCLPLCTCACAGSARDYLNAPVDTWLVGFNSSYTTSVTPEDGTDTVPGIRSNVFAQSLVLTRVMDYWGRTGGLSIVLPYAFIDTAAGGARNGRPLYRDSQFFELQPCENRKIVLYRRDSQKTKARLARRGWRQGQGRGEKNSYLEIAVTH